MLGLNGRQKAGVGLLISGLLVILEGIFKLGMSADPAWVTPVFGAIGYVATAVGLVVNLPNTPKA